MTLWEQQQAQKIFEMVFAHSLLLRRMLFSQTLEALDGVQNWINERSLNERFRELLD